MQTVLVIDDEEPLRLAVVTALRRQQYRVLEAASGDDGVRLARTQLPDLILSDINMADGDGYSVLRRLREDPVVAAIPVILMTGGLLQHGARRAMEAGADDYLPKPFDAETLLAAVRVRLERHRAEQTAPVVLGQILEATSDFICVARPETGRVVHLNAAARALFGMGPEADVASLELRTLFDRDAWPRIESEALPAALAQGRWNGESLLADQHGRSVPVSLVILAHRDGPGRVAFLSLSARDLSERVRAQAMLADSHQHLRDLAARLVSVQEAERARIAREVHDEFGSQLTGLKMDLAWLEKRLREAEDLAGRERWLEKVAAMHEHIGRAIQTVRRIATELRPGILDSLGLIPALEWQAREFAQRTGVACRLHSTLEQIDWDPERSTTLFRIFQEALTNVARHARATEVTVSLEQRGDDVTMTVQDNGAGIADLPAATRKSTGLLGMKERAALAGGVLSVESAPGRGTSIHVTLPLQRQP